MTAIEILRDIIREGRLSESNMARGQALIDVLDGHQKSHSELLADCRAQYDRGERTSAVKRYRVGAGCGLREALDVVSQGAKAS